MTRNQFLALKPGDRVRVVEHTWGIQAGMKFKFKRREITYQHELVVMTGYNSGSEYVCPRSRLERTDD